MATPTTLPSTFVAGNVLTAAQMNDLRGAFRVLQVVSTAKTSSFSGGTIAAGANVDVTDLSAVITPSSTSSKILIFASVSVGTYGGVATKRNGTLINIGDTAGTRRLATSYILGTNGNIAQSIPMSFLDSPNTISSVTYQVALVNTLNISTPLFCNRSDTDTDGTANRLSSTITVMEISA